MEKGWDKVLRRRAVARLGAARSTRSRALRLIEMSKRRGLVLTGKNGSPVNHSVSPSPYVSSPYSAHDSKDDSEDEPLVRRVKSYSGFETSTSDCSDSKCSIRKGASSSSEESECESASEEDSESDSDEGDEVIYLGEPNPETLNPKPETRHQTTPQTQTLIQMVPGILVDRVLLLDGAVNVCEDVTPVARAEDVSVRVRRAFWFSPGSLPGSRAE